MDNKRKNIKKILLMLLAGAVWFFANYFNLFEGGGSDINELISWLFVIGWFVLLIMNRTNMPVLITSACISTHHIIAILLYVNCPDKVRGWCNNRFICSLSAASQMWFCGLDKDNFVAGNHVGMYPGLLVSIVLTLLAGGAIIRELSNRYELILPEKQKNISVKTKKSLLIVTVVIMGIIIALCTHKSDRKMAMQLFGIDINDYQLISVNDRLSKTDYEGVYEVKLNVDVSQVNEIADMVRNDYKIYYFSGNQYEDYELEYIEHNIGRNLEEDYLIYYDYCEARRKVLFKDDPYDTSVFIIISEESNNDYEVIFRYMEEKR